jgi:ribosomal protein L40E
MLCRQCKTRNETGSKFCESCGGKLVAPKQKRPEQRSELPRKRTTFDDSDTVIDRELHKRPPEAK